MRRLGPCATIRASECFQEIVTDHDIRPERQTQLANEPIHDTSRKHALTNNMNGNLPKKGAISMFMRATLAGVAVMVLMNVGVAAQSVDSATVEALRQMAIAAGQTSSSAASPPVKSLAALEIEQKSLDRHRADFFARTYAHKSDSTVVQERATGSGVSLLLPGLHETPQPVDRETIQALRQMAITAGQISSSAARPPTKNRAEIEAEQRSLESHRAEFFKRTYTGQPVM